MGFLNNHSKYYYTFFCIKFLQPDRDTKALKEQKY